MHIVVQNTTCIRVSVCHTSDASSKPKAPFMSANSRRTGMTEPTLPIQVSAPFVNGHWRSDLFDIHRWREAVKNRPVPSFEKEVQDRMSSMAKPVPGSKCLLRLAVFVVFGSLCICYCSGSLPLGYWGW